MAFLGPIFTGIADFVKDVINLTVGSVPDEVNPAQGNARYNSLDLTRSLLCGN